MPVKWTRPKGEPKAAGEKQQAHDSKEPPKTDKPKGKKEAK